ncbi:MAG: TonB-dependent receptor [Gammaproteobacteria bacterium]|nr:TonB-dependent receptor [Gammaproteobacteria bacterium]
MSKNTACTARVAGANPLPTLPRAIALGVMLASGLGVTPVAGAAATGAESDRAIEEVVVSARRRDESLLEVPVAVSAFSGDELARSGAQDLTYLNRTVPNATMERSRSTNSTLTAFIRGVGQQDPVAGFEGGVGIYIDDVYLNRPQGAVLDVYDIERIEVLRGPQGTLYGRNTIGGAVKYVTRRLSAEPEAKIKVTGGSYNQADLIASFGLPVSDSLRVGGAVARMTRAGFGDNRFRDGVDNYNKDVTAARASLEWLPTPDLFVRIAGDWTEDESDARNGHRLLDAQFSGNFPKLDDVFDTRANLDVPDAEVVTRGASMLVEYTPSANWTVKNILAYRDNHSGQQIDFDSLPVVDMEAPFCSRGRSAQRGVPAALHG